MLKKIAAGILFLITIQVFGQTESESYLPLQTGNIYNYQKKINGAYAAYFAMHTESVKSDTIINGKKYFYFSLLGAFIRYDDTENIILTYDSGAACGKYLNERIIDNFNFDAGDTIKFCGDDNNNKICLGKDSILFFGEKNQAITFRRISDGWKITYLKDIGVYSYSIISGNDTIDYTLTDIKNANRLYGNPMQVYPNPFSPSTILTYTVTSYSKVMIKFSDSSGREIYKFSDFKDAGKHQFDYYKILKDLPNGVFYWKITTDANTLFGKVFSVR